MLKWTIQEAEAFWMMSRSRAVCERGQLAGVGRKALG